MFAKAGTAGQAQELEMQLMGGGSAG